MIKRVSAIRINECLWWTQQLTTKVNESGFWQSDRFMALTYQNVLNTYICCVSENRVDCHYYQMSNQWTGAIALDCALDKDGRDPFWPMMTVSQTNMHTTVVMELHLYASINHANISYVTEGSLGSMQYSPERTVFTKSDRIVTSGRGDLTKISSKTTNSTRK